jgi:hypothetical protein
MNIAPNCGRFCHVFRGIFRKYESFDVRMEILNIGILFTRSSFVCQTNPMSPLYYSTSRDTFSWANAHFSANKSIVSSPNE